MRHIDHIVVAVRELEQAADLYRRLGFQVGRRNRHPWGTENRLIQCGSSFIELITVGDEAHLIPPHRPHHFSFGAFVRDSLKKREGIAMLVLSSTNAAGDADRFAKQGIGAFEPFSFARQGTQPDGAETRVAFTLAFASDPTAPEAGCFVCQQHYPENFWDTRFQQHANRAVNITAVTLAALEPRLHEKFLTAFTGKSTRSLPGNGFRCELDGGRIDAVSADLQTLSSSSARWTSFTVQVSDMRSVERLLKEECLSITASADEIVLPPDVLHGVELRFEKGALN